MPLTLAHPLAVAPLARTGLPLGALVVGTIVPDLPVFARAVPGVDTAGQLLGDPQLPMMADQYRLLHSLLGLVTVNIVIGLVVLALWWWLLRPAYRDALTARLRGRTHAAPAGALTWLLAIPALLIGSLSHIVWDQFTHRTTWISQRIDVLQSTVVGIPVTSLLQYGSGIFGTIGVAVWLFLRISRLPEEATVPQRLPGITVWMFALPVAAGLVAFSVVLYRAAQAGAQQTLESFAFDAVTTTVSTMLCAAIVMAIGHRVVSARIAARGRLSPRH